MRLQGELVNGPLPLPHPLKAPRSIPSYPKQMAPVSRLQKMAISSSMGHLLAVSDSKAIRYESKTLYTIFHCLSCVRCEMLNSTRSIPESAQLTAKSCLLVLAQVARLMHHGSAAPALLSTAWAVLYMHLSTCHHAHDVHDVHAHKMQDMMLLWCRVGTMMPHQLLRLPESTTCKLSWHQRRQSAGHKVSPDPPHAVLLCLNHL